MQTMPMPAVGTAISLMSGWLQAADFQVLEKGEKITLTIPVQFHGTPIGQKEGGDTQFIVHELEARCLPSSIPSHVDVDIADLNPILDPGRLGGGGHG